MCLEHAKNENISQSVKINYLNPLKIGGSLINFFLLPYLSYKLFKYIQNNDIALVQSHLFRSNYVNLLTKFLFQTTNQVQIVNHRVISKYTNKGFQGKVNKFLIKYLYPYSNTIISVSNVVNRDMQLLFNFKTNLDVIYNPFDINLIKKLSHEKITDFNFNKEKFYLIVVGRLIKLKKIDDLINLLAKLETSVELILIGEGSERDNLYELSKDLNTTTRVHFLGWRDNPFKYIRKSNILLSASETESFGNTIIEAMICETLVISTDSGGPSEIIDHEINGVLVPVGSINMFFHYVNYFIENINISHVYTTNASIKVKKFNVDNIMNRYKFVMKTKDK